MKELQAQVVNATLKGEEVRIKSIDLVKLINQFRAEECNKTELKHKTLLESIRKEIKVLENALIAQQNFLPGSYKDLNNQERPCFEMNKAGVIQMLNKESAVVRYKTVQYIEKLEKQQHIPMTTEEIIIYQLQEQKKLKQQLNQVNNHALSAVNTANEVKEIVNTQMTINTTQQKQIHDAVNKKVCERLEKCLEFDHSFDKESHRPKFYSNIWNDLKRRFGVARYGDILHKDFYDAKAFVQSWIEPADIR